MLSLVSKLRYGSPLLVGMGQNLISKTLKGPSDETRARWFCAHALSLSHTVWLL